MKRRRHDAELHIARADKCSWKWVTARIWACTNNLQLRPSTRVDDDRSNHGGRKRISTPLVGPKRPAPDNSCVCTIDASVGVTEATAWARANVTWRNQWCGKGEKACQWKGHGFASQGQRVAQRRTS